MNRFFHFLHTLLVYAFRCSAVLVAGTVLYFPGFKGVWKGYLPLAIGGLIAMALVWAQPKVERRLAALKESVFLVLLVAIPALIQVLLTVVFRSHPIFDGWFVYREAVEWAQTGQMNPLTYYAPGQVWFFGIFFRLFGASTLMAQWVQIPLAVLIPVVAYGITRESVQDVARARWAALLIAFYPGLLLYILVTPYYFYMYTLAILLMVWSWLVIARRPNAYGAAMGGGLVAGWGALTKATLAVAPVQTLFFWCVAGVTTRRLRYGWVWLVFTLTLVAVNAPWMMRNMAVFDQPVLICTSGPLVFYSANNPESDGLYSSIPDEVEIRTPADMLAHMAWCNEQAKTFIRENPADFAWLVWMKFLHTWGTETTFVELINRDRQSLGALDLLLRFVVQIGWATLVALWCAYSLRAIRRRQPASLAEIAAAVMVFSKFLIYSVYEGGARHHLPAVPLIVVVVICLMCVSTPEDESAGSTAAAR